MSNVSRLRSLWRNLVHRRRLERDLDDEVRGALEMLAEEYRQAGMNPDEARRRATIQLGRSESLKERIRDVKGGAFVDGWIQDVRYAHSRFRVLAQSVNTNRRHGDSACCHRFYSAAAALTRLHARLLS